MRDFINIMKRPVNSNDPTLKHLLAKADVESFEDRVYRYEPNPTLLTIHLHGDKSQKSNIVAIIKRKTIIIVRRKENDWCLICCCGVEGWALLPESIFETTLVLLKKIRRFEDWKGNNEFLCGGRIMLGSDAKLFIVTNILIIAPSICTLLFVLPHLYYAIISEVFYQCKT